MISLENGADGFMFSVSENNSFHTANNWREENVVKGLRLYAITTAMRPKYARLIGQTGMSRKPPESFARQMITSGNVECMISCLKGDILNGCLRLNVERASCAMKFPR